jgi:UDP-N-acetylmuramoylalanine--D-glutamate ligase
LRWSEAETPLSRARRRFDGQRVLVLGLAREGIDLTRFLDANGARVTLSDRKPAEELAPQQAQLGGLTSVRYVLGSEDPSVLDGMDVVFASPGVPPDNPLLRAARARGIPVTSLIELFFELCPSPIIGITGSAGKTTTTTLVGEVLRIAGRETFVGGNIGRPLLGELPRMSAASWVVLELSSFQLEPLRVSPTIAVITNVTPNHLDRHPTMAAYWAAKGQILNHQRPSDWAVLNADDAWSSRYLTRGGVRRFSLIHDRPVDGAYLLGGELILGAYPLLPVAEVPLCGQHNLANVLAACLAADLAGVERRAMVEAVRGFTGVPHRLQTVADVDGVKYVNDSIATAPERSIAALRAFDEPLVLIAGGRDKHLPMQAWAELIVQRVRHVVLIGEMGQLVADALRNADSRYRSVSRARSMDEAVHQAARAARPGDVVLLSPGGTSYDQYRDFEERGADFARAVADLAQARRCGAAA